MQKFTKLMTFILAFAILFTPLAAAASTAPGGTPPVVDERWGVPVFAYGASLTEAQKNEVRSLLQITNQQVEAISVDANDLIRFLGSGNPNAQMISSALITRRAEGTGIEVKIITPENITRVTANQYANAMITAGVTDALVEIAAPIAVTGEAALTGIFKAFSERGYELDKERIQVGQEQLETVSQIANDLKGNVDFDPVYLDQAVIEIQTQLANYYDRRGEVASPEQVLKIINDALENNNLDDLLSEANVARLAGFAERFQLTDAINSPEFRDQLSNLADRVGSIIDTVDRNTVQRWWQRILDFGRSLLDRLSN